MADDIFLDVLTNREAYPDDRTIQVGDRTITVKDFRDRYMPKSDHTRASQQWAEERSRHEQAVSGLRQQLAAEVAAREQAGTLQTDASGRMTYETLTRDPVLRLLTAKIDAHERALAQQQQTYGRDQYITKLRELKSRDKDLNEQELIDYAVKHQIVDMDVAHRSFTRERDIESAVKKAREEGVEEGKRTARLPHVPNGGKRSPSQPPAEPKFGDVEGAMNDPEILAAMEGSAEA